MHLTQEATTELMRLDYDITVSDQEATGVCRNTINWNGLRPNSIWEIGLAYFFVQRFHGCRQMLVRGIMFR